MIAHGPTSYAVGQLVECSDAFTSAIGVHFAARSHFVVEIGGQTAGRSIKLRSCGPDASIVWISDGLFLVQE